MQQRIYDARLNRTVPLPWAEPIEVGYNIRYGDTARIRSSVERAAERRCPCVLDWEADHALERLDPSRSPYAVLETAIDQAKWILARAYESNPSVSVGLYGAGLPTPTRYQDIRTDPATWSAELSALSRARGADGRWTSHGLYEMLPVLHPTLYMPDQWREAEWWERRGREHTRQVAQTVATAGRSREKRVVPFVWPDSWERDEHAAQYVADVLLESDGVVLWGHPTTYADAAEDEARWIMIGEAVLDVLGGGP